jgi:hypothetical protein
MEILLVILVLNLRHISGGKLEISFNKSQGLMMTLQLLLIHVHSGTVPELVILLSHLRLSK